MHPDAQFAAALGGPEHAPSPTVESVLCRRSLVAVPAGLPRGSGGG